MTSATWFTIKLRTSRWFDRQASRNMNRDNHHCLLKRHPTAQYTRPYGRSVVSDESGSPPKASSSNHERQTRPRKRNIVIFGESGSGKSSVINAITQTQRAKTSSDATGCTFSYQRYPVDISGQSYVLFDTAGLNEGNISAVPAAKAEKELKSLLRGLMSPGSDGIGLLVYCVRSTRARQALIRNYNLFYSVICRKKVPIVVVVTGLENEADMQAWWHTNAKEFKIRGMHFQDHACVTTLHKHQGISDVFTRRITESRDMMRNLIVDNCSEWAVDDTWFNQSLADARYAMKHNWNSERSSPSTLIICGASPEEEEGLAHFGGEAYRVRPVPQPESTSSAKGGHEGDLLIYYAHADTLSMHMARRMFYAFYTAYRGNMVPVVIVVKGLNDRKSARQWVDRYIKHPGAGLLFSTFSPADLGDNYLRRHAEQDLHDLIRHSCLVRSVVKGGGVLKRFARLLGWP
ncbi:P-loop containing nucleoside triphosphate hydrolase protein [Suillus placidus]|uniref:P-loop containing nucleoside triphosphate hydrolase protein n=1 Tax=Suillus placidus TaxID=48579 RepID=A0A9P6ZIA1_9AGAM|nr:P-loop containing nucleoside triphosphate hydrolase protein [Suillus placidus]